MTRISYFTVNKNDLSYLQEWGAILMGKRKEEALESMRQEGVLFEAIYYQQMGDRLLCCGVMIGEMETPNPSLPINQDHEKFKKYLNKNLYGVQLDQVDWKKMKPLYELSFLE